MGASRPAATPEGPLNCNPPRSRPIAVIDIGSNSVFLLVVQVDGGRVKVLEQVKDCARLGASLDCDGLLRPEAIARTVAMLQRFEKVIEAHDAEVMATATAAVRAASNRDVLLEGIRAMTGIEVEVISGEKEAELVYLGVLQGIGGRGRRLLCVDVGGGSTELVLGRGGFIRQRASAPVGAVNVTHCALGAPPLSAANLEKAREEIRAHLRPTLRGFRERYWEEVIATSGTIKRVARIVLAGQAGGNSARIDGMLLTSKEISGVARALIAADSHAARLAIPGMDPERADVLLGGVLIFQEIARVLGIQRWRLSAAGLRMGMVADVLRRRGVLRLTDE